MSIPFPNFKMLSKKLLFFKFVSLRISQYFYEVTNENFLVYASGINPIISRAITTFLYCWGSHRMWVVKSSYLINIAGMFFSCVKTIDDITCHVTLIFCRHQKKLKVVENVKECKFSPKDNYSGVKQCRALK